MHKFAKEYAACHELGNHLDSLTIQKIATRAFDAVAKYMYKTRGRPRFKRVCKRNKLGRLNSVEGKNNASGIRYINNQVVWNVKGNEKLVLDVIIDKKDKYGVLEHALSCRVKYVRIVKKIVGKKLRFVAQLILEGKPKQKYAVPVDETVALDVGPSSIAVYSKNDAFIEELCPDIDLCVQEIKNLQKLMDRSRRATNPDNYDDNGVVKKGAKSWVYSNNYLKMQDQRKVLENKLKVTRKHQHGNAANRIVACGANIKMEKTSVKGWQKGLFGKSVGRKGPSILLEMIKRKAANAGGKVIEINTYATKLSQTCICQTQKKKPLSQRWHECNVCGIKCQRDLFSAYLAYHVEDNILDIPQSKKDWASGKPLLERAISSLKQPVTCYPASFGLSKKPESELVVC